MRCMWICHKLLSPVYIRKCLADRGMKLVMRSLTFSHWVGWASISSFETYDVAKSLGLVDAKSDHCSITACNKQYVVNECTGKYLGALGEVDLSEARAWVLEDNANWFLCANKTNILWMPVQRNPNKLIPTGKSTVCLHCGSLTTSSTLRPQHRPWPFHSDA